ncbi:hypothetical protein GJ496_003900 [Pomphorhynchus laevis]|nr:hypothetical protein GJ496_003900 [Pomphorhynchus laevis]
MIIQLDKSLFIIAIASVMVVMTKYSEWESQVPYCEVAPVKCSLERNDNAFMPYNGSRCYCDYFCYRTEDSHDCCPDFEYVCDRQFTNAHVIPASIKAGHQCEWNGQLFRENESRIDDCNACICQKTLTIQSSHQDDDNLLQWKCEQDLCANSNEVLDLISQNTAEDKSWTASKYSRWNNSKYSKLKIYSLGTILDSQQKRIIDNYNSRDPDVGIYSFVPPDNWTVSQGGWKVGSVRDQGNCGSSWALSAVDVASDRVSLYEDKSQNQLSVQYVLSCSGRTAKDSCRAGRIEHAWGFLKDFGVPYESFYPYESGRTGLIGYCAHFPDLDTPKAHNYVPSSTYHRFSPAYKIDEETLQIKYELFERGPVQATMLVCPDFFQYKSGVYKSIWPSKERSLCDYHSVRLIGWSKYTNIQGRTIEYWICINSWGNDWGENGYFKIEIGDSDINKYVVSTWGKTSKFHVRR